jgi:hypothetical protein
MDWGNGRHRGGLEQKTGTSRRLIVRHPIGRIDHPKVMRIYVKKLRLSRMKCWHRIDSGRRARLAQVFPDESPHFEKIGKVRYRHPGLAHEPSDRKSRRCSLSSNYRHCFQHESLTETRNEGNNIVCLLVSHPHLKQAPQKIRLQKLKEEDCRSRTNQYSQ